MTQNGQTPAQREMAQHWRARTEVLSLEYVGALAAILSVAERNAPVGRIIDGRPFYGKARSIGDANGMPCGGDVRDMYLCVTLLAGVNAFWPVRELAAQYLSGEFVPDAAMATLDISVQHLCDTCNMPCREYPPGWQHVYATASRHEVTGVHAVEITEILH